MSSYTREQAWEAFFDAHDVLATVDDKGYAVVKADQMKPYYEPRLMASITNKKALPGIMEKHGLGILPVTRGEYVIASFDLFKTLRTSHDRRRIPRPSSLPTLNNGVISNEAVAISYADYSGIYDDFLGESVITATQSGRMGSGDFVFQVKNKAGLYSDVKVHNAQIEIDGSFETADSFVLIEAKNVPHDSFLIRQLFYPFKAWEHHVKGKRIRTVFQVYTNGIYNLYEYEFEDPNNYNSLILTNQQNYYLGSITRQDIQDILRTTTPEPEPQIPFIQANSIERVITLCELAADAPLTKQAIVDEYEFDPRQSDYYVNAARYLGLIEAVRDTEGVTNYILSTTGVKIFKATTDYSKRYLKIIKRMALHSVFHEVIAISLEHGVPLVDEIAKIMTKHPLFNVNSESTYTRRASSVRKWVMWVLSLID